MDHELIRYEADRAQSQRDARRTPQLTMRDVLKIFHKFVQDFESFDLEHLNNPRDSEEVGPLCSDESDRSSEGSDSTLDEMALVYAEEEDINELIAPTVDPVIGEIVSPRKEAASSSTTTVHYPLTFLVRKGWLGNITHLKTLDEHAPYQYCISLKPNHLLNAQSLHFIIEILEREQVWATALTRFIESVAISKYKYKTPRWLPAVLRCAAHENVHECILKLLHYFFRSSYIFEDFERKGNLTYDVQDMLEDFYRVANSMEVSELQLFADMNNAAVFPDVQKLASPPEIQEYLHEKGNKLCHVLQKTNIRIFMEEAQRRLPLIGGIPTEPKLF